MKSFLTRAVLAPAILLTGMGVQAADWVIDKADSKVVFKWTYSGTPYQGEFRNISATFDIDPLNPTECKFDVTIPIIDMVIDDAETMDYPLDLELFDADQFPEATFKAEKCSIEGIDAFTSEGTLTIRDQTNPIAFPFNLSVGMEDGGVRFHLTSEVTINRLEYGVGQGYWASTAAIPNEVVVEVDVYAVRQ